MALDALRTLRGAVPAREVRDAAERAVASGAYEESIDLFGVIGDREGVREVGTRAHRDGRYLVAISAFQRCEDTAALARIAQELSSSANSYFLMLAEMAYRHAGVEPAADFLERLADEQLRTHPDASSASRTYARAGRRPSPEMARAVAAERLSGNNVPGALSVYELGGVAPDAELLIAAGDRLYAGGDLRAAVVAFQAAGAPSRAIAIADELLCTNPYALRVAVEFLSSAGASDRIVAAATAAYASGDHARVRALLSAMRDAERLVRYGHARLAHRDRAEATAYYEAAERLQQRD